LPRVHVLRDFVPFCATVGGFPLQHVLSSPPGRPAGVELLILRILRQGFAGTLVSGALGAAGCADELDHHEPATEQAQGPSAATDAAPIPRDAHVHDNLDTPSSERAADASLQRASDASSQRDVPAPWAGDAGAELDAGADPDATVSRPTGCALDQATVLRADGLRPAESYDYIAIRRVNGSYTAEPDAGTEEHWTSDRFETLSESGAACVTNVDAACLAQLAHHPAEFVASFCVQACVEYAVVTARGNQVQRWATDAELLRLLGTIDSTDEALLLATRAGYMAACASQEPDGLHVVATRYKDICPIVYERVTLRVSGSGALEVVNAVELQNQPLSGACVGRVPAGLCSVSAARHESAVGDYLAHCAHLEDASVYAFERLARDLTAHGAPRAMVAAALHAADDEVRHARVIGALACARGGQPVAAEVREPSPRTLEQIATENATEGCVRETFGALLGGYQARHAGDAGIRSVMREVAADEARHAALSHRVHSWALTKLEPAARERVLAAQQKAIAELTRACSEELDVGLRGPLGLPSAQVAQALLRELSLALWEPRQGEQEHDLSAASECVRAAS
jgi:hypothetical protein